MFPNWNKTIIGTNRLDVIGKLETPNGVPSYKGRPLIGRDTRIDNGVYVGTGSREAIVVDSKKYVGITRMYEEAKNRSTVDGTIRRNLVLRNVYDVVLEEMPRQDNNAVEAVIIKNNLRYDRKVSLDVFLDEGIGVCRHDALACGGVIEKFTDDGFIRGKVSVDRNSDDPGGHAWARYTCKDGDIIILDIAQGFIGTLKEAKERRVAGENIWDYRRPEDVEANEVW